MTDVLPYEEPVTRKALTYHDVAVGIGQNHHSETVVNSYLRFSERYLPFCKEKVSYQTVFIQYSIGKKYENVISIDKFVRTRQAGKIWASTQALGRALVNLLIVESFIHLLFSTRTI